MTETKSVTERQLVACALFRELSREEADAAFVLVRDTDIMDPICRRVWQAARDSWEADARIDIGSVQRDVRMSMNGTGPLGAWYTAVADEAYVGLDFLEVARRVALDGCTSSEKSAAQKAALVVATGDVTELEMSIEGLRAAQARRDEIETGKSEKVAGPRDLADLFASSPPPPAEELVEHLIARPGVVIVYGASGSGKSYALKAGLLDLVCGGGAFCGVEQFQIRPRRSFETNDLQEVVLWVYGSEDHERRIHRRAIDVLASGPHADKPFPRGRFLITTPPAGTCLGSKEGVRWLDREMARSGATVVVLDTIQSLTSATIDTSKAEHVARWMVELHRLRDKHGAVIIPVAHTSKTPSDAKSPRTKADSLLGSQAWRALSDGLVMLDAPDGDASQAQIRIVKGKDIDSPPLPTKLVFDGEGKRFMQAAEEGEQPVPPPARKGRPAKVTVDVVLALEGPHPEGVQWADIHDAIGVSRSTWYEHRSAIQTELLRLGHTVVGGTLRWAR